MPVNKGGLPLEQALSLAVPGSDEAMRTVAAEPNQCVSWQANKSTVGLHACIDQLNQGRPKPCALQTKKRPEGS
jgi:hypothetical protein